jgi:hypothetical protein
MDLRGLDKIPWFVSPRSMTEKFEIAISNDVDLHFAS